ncbi:hypothetical protein PAMA_021126 [Pampus argenteus]
MRWLTSLHYIKHIALSHMLSEIRWGKGAGGRGQPFRNAAVWHECAHTQTHKQQHNPFRAGPLCDVRGTVVGRSSGNTGCQMDPSLKLLVQSILQKQDAAWLSPCFPCEWPPPLHPSPAHKFGVVGGKGTVQPAPDVGLQVNPPQTV